MDRSLTSARYAHVLGAVLFAGWLATAWPSWAADDGASPTAKVTPEQEKFFEEKIRPVLANKCWECHGSKKAESGLRLADAQVSSAHCRIFRGSTGQRFWVADLGSDRGTWLNGRRIRRAVLRNGDRLEVGRVGLTFRVRDVAI